MKKPKPLSWKAVGGPNGVYCSPACGRGCTSVEHDRAQDKAKALAVRLGPTWAPHVWENLGWHYAALSACGRLKVTEENARHYTAYLGACDGLISGRFAEYGSKPRLAVRSVLTAARTATLELEQLVRGLEDMP